MMELYDYQKRITRRAASILNEHGFVYLALEMRLGKTIISLTLAEVFKARRVVFLTKKKAISSVEKDFRASGYGFDLEVVNYESAHKVDLRCDMLILDEAHILGTYPKPNDKARLIREKATAKRVIFLSGTPSPETYSQLFHQFWAVKKGPWQEFKKFYHWAGNPEKPNYVTVTRKMINGIPIPDYKKADEKRIKEEIGKYMISMSQKEAGFDNHAINEEIIEIDAPQFIAKYERILTEDRFYQLKDGRVIVCDTAVKLMQKLHQIWSGSVITDDENDREAVIISPYKAEYIKSRYAGKKIAIFYLYRAEGQILEKVFREEIEKNAPESLLCRLPLHPACGAPKFDGHGSSALPNPYLGQLQSGSMGVDLSGYDYLIFFNISFSAMLYFQARARTGSHSRKDPQRVVWIFSKGGIERKIYDAVSRKKDYTLNYFRRDYTQEVRRIGA